MKWVDETEVLRRAEGLLRGEGGGAQWTRFRNWLRRQPGAPDLVNRETAATILGVQSPHIARLQRQERMPEAFSVEGGPDVWARSEVEALAKILNRERAERAKKRKKAADASR